jgi:hypothetical protein
MASSRLSPLQRRVLRVLAGIDPPWTLVGGAALAGFHLGHRTTQDLDLFWRGLGSLGSLAAECIERLVASGLHAERLQTGETFSRLRVADAKEAVVVDLVAEPTPPLEQPIDAVVEGVGVPVATEREILADKLCALLSRSELRDLVDVRALLAKGLDFAQGVADAPRKDAGFSPLTLAWVLRGWPIETLATRDETRADVEGLVEFRDDLVRRLVAWKD